MGEYIVFLWVLLKDIDWELGGTVETYKDAFWKFKIIIAVEENEWSIYLTTLIMGYLSHL